jgi:hypothetical protein
MVVGSRSPWGYFREEQNSFRHGPGESESLGVLGRTKIASVMALGSRSPWGYLGEEQKQPPSWPWGVGVPGGTWRRIKIAFRHGPFGES